MEGLARCHPAIDFFRDGIKDRFLLPRREQRERKLWIICCLKVLEAIVSSKAAGFDNKRDDSCAALFGSSQEWRELVVCDEVGRHEIGTDEKYRGCCPG